MRQESNSGRIEGVTYRNPIVSVGVEGLSSVCSTELDIKNRGNLDEVRYLSSKKIPIVFVANHLSNSDALIISQGLIRAGYRDIQERMKFLLGLKLLRHPVTRFFSKSSDYIPVWPPSLKPRNDKEHNQMYEMMKQALQSATEVLTNGDYVTFFPQGGRGKTGKIEEVYPATTNFITRVKGTHVVPVALFGTEKILPVNSFIPRIRKNASVEFGRPINIEKVKESLRENGVRGHDLKVQILDIVMRDVAHMLPEEYRGIYGNCNSQKLLIR